MGRRLVRSSRYGCGGVAMASIDDLSSLYLRYIGYYAGAILRFRLTFPDDYPDKIPTVQFVTDIFHPLIDQKGYFNLAAHIRPWK